MHDTGERWRPALGFEDFYDVSDHGRVRTKPVRERRARYRKTPINSDGYPVVMLFGDGYRKTVRVNRLVLSAFVGPCPPRLEGCHRDGDKTNNHLSNLRWGTSGSNKLDAVSHGTHVRSRQQACPRGHLYLPGNLVVGLQKRGWRGCLSCNRARAIIQRSKKRGAPHKTLAEESAPIYAEIARIYRFPPYEESPQEALRDAVNTH